MAATFPYLRLLLLGSPKSGKTTCALRTCPTGEGKRLLVINSDQPGATASAAGADFDEVFADSPQSLENALKAAREGVKGGRVGAVVWDTITEYGRKAQYLFDDATANAAGEPDGRRSWPKFNRNVQQALDRLMKLDAHVVVIAHSHVDEDGVTLNLSGSQAKAQIPAAFHDVWMLEKRGGGEAATRCLSLKRGGALGSRFLRGVTELPADVGELWKRISAGVGL